MIISVQDLQKFTGVFPEAEQDLQEWYVGSACEIVSNYLGYNPETNNYKLFLDGTGTNVIKVPNKNIQSVRYIFVDNKKLNENDYSFESDEIFFLPNKGTFPNGIRNIEISFTGGFENVPQIIKLTALRIAGILQTESNNNVGISSKSFQNEGTRTFVNTTNFDKYLLQISDYKIV